MSCNTSIFRMEISVGIPKNVKGVNGCLGWLSSTARPHVAASHSILPSRYDRRSPKLISKVNAAVKQCHAVPITITIWPILFKELRWTTFTDSSFDTGERQRHQQGSLVCATNKYSNQERSAPVSVLHWRSRKLTRKAGSPHLVETYAASSALVVMTLIKTLWESIIWKDFHAHFMDSKGLFDELVNDFPQDDRKSALEEPIIEEFMRRAKCRSRWCPAQSKCR